MEFVVIQSRDPHKADVLANQLRAHGYHHFSPELFFMDDFGDLKPHADQLADAEAWCRKHVSSEMAHHQDVVVQGVLLNPDLVRDAQTHGYHLAVLKPDEESEDAIQQQIDALIRAHEGHDRSLFQRIFEHRHG
ncbi:hypothetical protein [Reinekea blandensis]|uniref:Uncharacterized protein n=1 Tax=Reinekea blandensis MED297 TaxID=314283 RepID=A4BDD1_9GAMM|nr:hypothetical protein [Reinekea blandensis]EAR09875.1 hypothetical protein MED297_05984 [Reinekea sp. MED297] [Reinekea blandensis MED297]